MTRGQDHDTPTADNTAGADVGGIVVALGTPRRLPSPTRLAGRVAVVDIAFAGEGGGKRQGFEKTTLRFIERLGDRLAAWVDHHDSEHHPRFASDARFTLASKAEHGACPEMITPEVVARAGKIDTLVCHNDFDGLASAAKWILGGEEPYPGCDDDARAIDTRVGTPGPRAFMLDRALRALPGDDGLRLALVELLVARDEHHPAWADFAAAADGLEHREQQAERLARHYRPASDELVVLDASDSPEPYDRTKLLLLGQEIAPMAAVIQGETVTFAAAYGSGINFLERFGLTSGMPTLVSIFKSRLPQALEALGVERARWDQASSSRIS